MTQPTQALIAALLSLPLAWAAPDGQRPALAQDSEEDNAPPAERRNAMGGANRRVKFPLPEGWTQGDPGSGRTVYRFQHDITGSIIEVKGAFVRPIATDAFYEGFRKVYLKDRRFQPATSKELKTYGGATGILDTYLFNPDGTKPQKTQPTPQNTKQSEPTSDQPEDNLELAVHTFVFYTKANDTAWAVIYYGSEDLATSERLIYQRVTAVFCPKACKGRSPLEPDPGAPRKAKGPDEVIEVEVKVKAKAVEPSQNGQ